MSQNSQRTKMLRHAWPLIVAQRRDAGFGLILHLLAVGAALYLPWPMKVIVDSILTDKTPAPAWLPVEKLPALAAVCGVLLAMHFLRGWLFTWSATLLVRAGLRMTHDLRCRVYERLQKLSLVFHEKRPVGDSIYRVTWDTYSIQTLFNQGLVSIIGSGVTLIGIMVIMLRFDVTLTVLALAVAPALGWAIRFYNRRISAVSIDYHDREAKVSSLIQESLSAIRTIQAFAREEDEGRTDHCDRHGGDVVDWRSPGDRRQAECGRIAGVHRLRRYVVRADERPEQHRGGGAERIDAVPTRLGDFRYRARHQRPADGAPARYVPGRFAV